LYAMCECAACGGTGKEPCDEWCFVACPGHGRCLDCRGEGRTRREVASATDEASLGLALVTCAREGEWSECLGFGLLDREGETGQKWLVRPWQPSSRNVSDAARVLAKSKTKEKT
jgi:hypothetical protein